MTTLYMWGLISQSFSFTAKKPVDKDEEDSFLCDMEEDPLLNDNDDDAHIVPLACTLSPVFSSDREGSCELQELEALKHELISMQEHLDEMNNSSLLWTSFQIKSSDLWNWWVSTQKQIIISGKFTVHLSHQWVVPFTLHFLHYLYTRSS